MSREDSLNEYVKVQQLSKRQEQQLRELSKFQPTMVGIMGTHVISQPDVGTKFPIYIDQTITSEIESPLTWFMDFGQAEPSVEFRSFTDDEIERMSFGNFVLKLPGLIVVDAVMNHGLSMEEMELKFGRPTDEVNVPALISLGKLSMQGKTMLAVELRRLGMEVVAMSGFSDDNLESYWAELGETPYEMTRKEAIAKILTRFNRDERKSVGKRQEWNARLAIDNLSKVFEEGNRPEMVVCDMPGRRIPKEGEDARITNIFDFIAEHSMTMVGLNRIGPNGIDTESEIDWRVVDDYVNHFFSFKDDILRTEMIRGKLFSDMINRNEESYRQHFMAWVILRERVESEMEMAPVFNVDEVNVF